MSPYTTVDRFPEYAISDRWPVSDPVDRFPEFTASLIWVSIYTHAHLYFVIPTGAIDGANCDFEIAYDTYEVLLNGQQMSATFTATGFALDEPPQPGDLLWCQVARRVGE